MLNIFFSLSHVKYNCAKDVEDLFGCKLNVRHS